MKLTYNDKFAAFVFECSFEEHMIPKAAKFWWQSIVPRKWATKKVEIAARLIEYADDRAKAMLGKAAEAHKKALEASRATDADIEVPAPTGLDYMPFQKAGIAYALKAFGDG